MVKFGNLLNIFIKHKKFSHNLDVYNLLKNTDTCTKIYCVANLREKRYSSKCLVNKHIYGNLTIDNAIDIIKSNNILLRSDWDLVKIDMMRYVLCLKFLNNVSLKKIFYYQLETEK